MGFSGIFAIGISGVSAYSTSLEAVSDNIANSGTVGFKRARTDFSELVTAAASDGGIAGGGVDAQNRQMIAEQGAITRTSSETDIAVSGDGFFVVSEAADSNPATDPFLFTRAGGFSAQADGALVNEAGYYLRGVEVDGAGATSVAGGLNALQTVNINRFETLAEATSNISVTGNLSATAALGDVLNQTIQIFDANGASSNLDLSFTNVAPSQWNASAAIDGTTLSAGALAVNANGLIDASASSFPTTLTVGGNQAINLDLTALTQLARQTAITNVTADGAQTGALTGVDISRDGLVTAQFSNGLTRDIYQIALATFINPEGLDDGPASTFLSNPDAGDLTLAIPATGRAGVIESAALEISTVDIGQEFSTLIETQRAYSANTRVITVADELWQTLTQTAR